MKAPGHYQNYKSRWLGHFFFVDSSLIPGLGIIPNIDTGTTRCSSAGHSSKRNQKNFGKKLFTTDPLRAVLTKSCTSTL